MTVRLGAPALSFEVDHSPSPGESALSAPPETPPLPHDDDATEEWDVSTWGLDCFEVDCL